ncbi:MAG: AbrB/MazE/SpoVT family DNA-binding domain-containing protein [Nanoarchaeota archaeon]
MEQIKTKVKKWGNSFGIIIPRDIVEKENLKEEGEIFVTIQTKKYTTVGDIFGILKGKRKSKKSTQEIMDEIDKEFWPEDE